MKYLLFHLGKLERGGGALQHAPRTVLPASSRGSGTRSYPFFFSFGLTQHRKTREDGSWVCSTMQISVFFLKKSGTIGFWLSICGAWLQDTSELYTSNYKSEQTPERHTCYEKSCIIYIMGRLEWMKKKKTLRFFNSLLNTVYRALTRYH